VVERNKRTKTETLIYLIPELCLMTGLTDEVRNNFNDMKKLNESLKPNSSSRLRDCKDFIRSLNESSKDFIKNWGVDL
jgi:aubergine-like protein